MKKQIVLFLLSVLALSQTSYAGSGAWRLGYGETYGLSTGSGLDGLNKLLQASQLPTLSNDYLNVSQSYVSLTSGKWLLSYGSMGLGATSTQVSGGYKSSLMGKGNTLKVGYNVLHGLKSQLFINFGGGIFNMKGTLTEEKPAKIDDVDLFNFRNREITITQQSSFFVFEGEYLYPVFTQVLGFIDLHLGANVGYRYHNRSIGRLNNSAIDLGDTNLSGITAALSARLSFSIGEK